jgi:hypothetical protein
VGVGGVRAGEAVDVGLDPCAVACGALAAGSVGGAERGVQRVGGRGDLPRALVGLGGVAVGLFGAGQQRGGGHVPVGPLTPRRQLAVGPLTGFRGRARQLVVLASGADGGGLRARWPPCERAGRRPVAFLVRHRRGLPGQFVGDHPVGPVLLQGRGVGGDGALQQLVLGACLPEAAACVLVLDDVGGQPQVRLAPGAGERRVQRVRLGTDAVGQGVLSGEPLGGRDGHGVAVGERAGADLAGGQVGLEQRRLPVVVGAAPLHACPGRADVGDDAAVAV